jgi:hypothetical protein
VTGTVISGSSVLWFVDDKYETWKPGDLDIYTPHGKAARVLEFLIRDGYSVIPKERDITQKYMENGHLSSITKLQKGECTIDLLESLTSSSITPITVFHSTAVMNYITADSIVMLYPFLTLCGYSACHYAAAQRGDHWHVKYVTDRQYTVRESYHLPQELQWQLCPSLYRRPLDRLCLSVAFDDGQDRVSRKQPGWSFVSNQASLDQHYRCKESVCRVSRYQRHPPDAVAIDVIVRATFDM